MQAFDKCDNLLLNQILNVLFIEEAVEEILLGDIGAEAGSDRYWAVEDAGRRIEAHRGQ